MSYTSLKASEVDLLVKNEYLSGYNSYELKGPSLFNVDSPTRLNEKESVVGTDGSIEAVAEGAATPITTVREFGTKTFISVEYKRGYAVTELCRDFSNYGSTLKVMNKAGYRAKYRQDELMCDVLKNGFDVETTWDGAYIYSATHHYNDGPTHQSNLLTGALSKTNINAGFVKLSTLKDRDGLNQPCDIAVLVVPAALYMDAWTWLNSPEDPGTPNRAKNFCNSLKIQLMYWPLLDTKSATAYYMFSQKQFHTFKVWQKVQPSITSYIDDATGNLVEKVRFVQIQGTTDYNGTVASTGA